ncbi:MAG TPA: hypothetical protein DCS83_00030 [Prevotella sp.]|nr:hypothetical protein [Prevotella sp.]
MFRKEYITPQIKEFIINTEPFLADSYNAKNSFFTTLHQRYEVDKTEIAPDFGFHWDTGDEPYKPHDK